MQVVTVSLDELQSLIESTMKRVIATNAAQSIQPTTIDKTLATRQQAADFFGITLPTLLKHTIEGKVVASRIGRRVLYKWSDLNAALSTINTGK